MILSAVALAASNVMAGSLTLTPSKDNTMFYDPNVGVSNGAGPYMFVGATAGGNVRRALMAFDITNGLPTNASVTSATLTVNVSKAQLASNIELHAATKDWGEGASNSGDPGGSGALSQPGDASWFYNFYQSSHWTNPGGDYSSTVSAVTPLGNGGGVFSGSQMVADIQNWKANPSANFGWVLKSPDETPSTAKRIDSRENLIAENRPALTVGYNAATWKTMGGPWSSPGSWNFGIPNTAGAEANFTFASGTGMIAVTVDAPKTISYLNISSTNRYSFSGAAINLNRSTGNMRINVGQGDHEMQNALNLQKNTDVEIAAGATLAVKGAFSSGGINIKKTGEGTLKVNRIVAAGLNVEGGRIIVPPNGADNNLSTINALTMDPAAVLDLNDNDLVVNNGNFQALSALVFQGYRDAVDTLAIGIISTTSQTTPGHPILALFDNAIVQTSDFPFGSGQALAPNAIAGKYTYIGDADMNGMVTPDDYGAVDSNLGSFVDPRSSWFAGDWNFDGQITPDDYLAIDANLGLGENQPLGTNGLAAVPEPGVGTVMGVAAVIAVRRRRRQR
ncbi:MAG TPA: DNRLRE domain-containing protein [Tepidisphaeraceae bacterium]